MNGGNWKMRCVNNKRNINNYTIGKVYDVKDGYVIGDDGEKVRDIPFTSFCEWLSYTYAKWELVKSEFTLDDIKEGYLVKIRDGRLLLTVRTDEGLIGYNIYANNVATFCSEYYTEDMKSKNELKFHDVVEVYGDVVKRRANSLQELLFSTYDRTLLYKREELSELSPQQLKLKELEDKQREIADEISKLRESL